MESRVWILFLSLFVRMCVLEEIGYIQSNQYSHSSSLNESNCDVTPVVFVVRHSRKAHIYGKSNEPKLEHGS